MNEEGRRTTGGPFFTNWHEELRVRRMLATLRAVWIVQAPKALKAVHCGVDSVWYDHGLRCAFGA